MQCSSCYMTTRGLCLPQNPVRISVEASRRGSLSALQCCVTLSYFRPTNSKTLRSSTIFFLADHPNWAKFLSLKCAHILFWLNPMGHSKFHNTPKIPSSCYRPQSDCLYSFVPTSAGGPPFIPSPLFFLSQTEEPAKVGTCARDRRALQQLALNVHIELSDPVSLPSELDVSDKLSSPYSITTFSTTVFTFNTTVFTFNTTVFTFNTTVFTFNTTVFTFNTTVFTFNTTVFTFNTTVFTFNTTVFGSLRSRYCLYFLCYAPQNNFLSFADRVGKRGSFKHCFLIVIYCLSFLYLLYY